MAMRGILRGLGGKAPGVSDATASQETAPRQPVTVHDQLFRLQLLDEFEGAGVTWFWATDDQNRLIYLSPGAATAFCADPSTLFDRPLASLFLHEQGGRDEADAASLPFLLSARSTFADLTVKLAAASDPRQWVIGGKPYLDPGGAFLGYRGTVKEMAAEHPHVGETAPAQFDTVTGLSSRSRMAARLTATLAASRAAKRSCALMTLNLDRFKRVNDVQGRLAGDELLKQAAQRLQRVVGGRGEIGRIGGDEFQIMLPGVDDRGELGELAHRVIQMVSQPYSLDGTRAIAGASVGLAVAPYDGIEPVDLVRSAGLALDAANAGGHGQYRFYSNDLKDSAHKRREIEEDLQDALARGELQMHYQPVVRTTDNQVTGFEALMRWEHPARGPIGPGVFIPVAEQSDLIVALGEWALKQACADAARWSGELRVAVNVSANQFGSEKLPDAVGKALAASGLKAERLELEITEGALLGGAAAVDETFARLREMGVRLVLDDFGSGYSSLGCLRKAPFDKIKIDQSLVRAAGCVNSALIAAIVSLAQVLGVETTAEGVESMDELELVRARGVSSVQGFIYSRAVPQHQVLDKLRAGNPVYEPAGPAKQQSQRRSLLRRIGVIHEDHRYEAVLRNLTLTGAMIEGLLDVPVGTQLVLDLGEGQLAVCTVRRSQDASQGVEFETPLISDGAGGLCTRHRISPYVLAAAGMPLTSLAAGAYPLIGSSGGSSSPRRFMQVDVGAGASRAA